MSSNRALVAGGGLGGLSAAIHLAVRGWRVTLLEKNAALGGKCNHAEWGGYQFDTGPSLLTLPQVARELFAAAGRRLEDYLELMPVRPACHYVFADGLAFDAPGNLGEMRDAVRAQFPADAEGFERYAAYSQKLWEVSAPLFLWNRLEPRTVLKVPPLAALRGLAALRPETLGHSLDRFFKSPHLRQLFSRYATYNGSDPARTPATFNVIAHAEMAFGSWHIRGGLYKLVEALARLAQELGVELRPSTPVARVCFSGGGRAVRGVETACGEIVAGGVVVINADAVTACAGPLLADHPHAARWRATLPAREASGSGFALLLALDRTFEGLACHNVFFCADYPREFREIFGDARPLADPTIYISIPSKIDSTQSPPGTEGWFVLVNAPSLDRCPAPRWPENYAEVIIAKLARLVPGFQPPHVRWQRALPPAYWQSEYGAWQGALYGLSSNGLSAAFFRQRNRGPARGLYFAGGSAHPGGGIPLVLLSGRHAADAAGAPG